MPPRGVECLVMLGVRGKAHYSEELSASPGTPCDNIHLPSPSECNGHCDLCITVALDPLRRMTMTGMTFIRTPPPSPALK